MGNKTSRLNDTAAVASMPVSEGHYASVSVRKIDNGYITSRTSNHGQNYVSTETFSENQPDLDGGIHGPDSEGNPMRRAAEYLAKTNAI